MQLSTSKQKLLFLFIIIFFFGLLLLRLDFLAAPPLYDEIPFWNSSLLFSDRLIPSLEDLRSYGDLNTPLPFIIYGALEYFSGQGFIAGRLLNIILLLLIAIAIGWPRANNHQPILCLVGLLIFPYNFLYGGHLYTDIIACAFVLLGVISYQRGGHLLSCIAFILAISSRQYMVAFPAAIGLYELAIALLNYQKSRQFNLSAQWRWIAPILATLSFLGWIYLFQGLTPQVESALDKVDPKVQTTAWILDPGRGINYLGSIATYIVIPECVLFRLWHQFFLSKQQRRAAIAIGSALLVLAAAFPPLLYTRNAINVIAGIFNNTQYEFIGAGIYCLACLLTIVRFSKLSLLSLMVITNTIIMTKVYPWDKYLWPFVVVFWYLKATQPNEEFISTEHYAQKDNVSKDLNSRSSRWQ